MRTLHSAEPSQPALGADEYEVALTSAVARSVREMVTWSGLFACERRSGYSRFPGHAQTRSTLASPLKTLVQESVLGEHEALTDEAQCPAEVRRPENACPHLAVRQPRIDAAKRETRADLPRSGVVAVNVAGRICRRQRENPSQDSSGPKRIAKLEPSEGSLSDYCFAFVAADHGCDEFPGGWIVLSVQ